MSVLKPAAAHVRVSLRQRECQCVRACARSRSSVATLKLICCASSLASRSAALALLPEVSGRREPRMVQPQASQQKSRDLAGEMDAHVVRTGG